ncbi:hypothetical protein [Peribacillus huizhouensis]|uniref:DUF2232 domain-containing protein n=1 Tax=Peribacillus huizhouensis TaxID=1501239 RepID=A0ABR6CP47_9BACI|nr:hypothetical protein [Peribacillus huizhouensis]MBA9026819.1 hypothetical protein [Peribacillus huizhouensis]
MFHKFIRLLDIIALFFSIIAVYAIFNSGSMNIVNILFIVISPTLLLLSKFKGSRTLLFFAYVCSSIFFLSVLYNGFFRQDDFFHSGLLAVGISLLAIVFSIFAAVIGFGTSTLTIVWLTLHGLVVYEALQLAGLGGFLDTFWSQKAIETAISNDYAFLLMFVWIGLFLDKYEKAIVREYISR